MANIMCMQKFKKKEKQLVKFRKIHNSHDVYSYKLNEKRKLVIGVLEKQVLSIIYFGIFLNN